MALGVFLEVCSVCQFNCSLCAHEGLRAVDPRYHMSIAEVEEFVAATEESGYAVNIGIHGAGEPLLWKHLKEGLTKLRASKSVERIVINSNGLLMAKNTYILDLVDSVRISLYPDSKMEIVEHPKVVYNPHPFFVDKQFPAPIPCTCLCSGPMIYKGMVFPDCGPPLFDAIIRMKSGKDPMSFGVKLAPHYADAPQKSGTFAECTHCWANSNCTHLVERHNTGTKASAEDASLPSTGSTSPGSPSVRESVETAFERFNTGNIEGADAICSQLIEANVNSFYVFYLAGIIASQSQRLPLAKERLQAALNHAEGVPQDRVSEVLTRLADLERA